MSDILLESKIIDVIEDFISFHCPEIDIQDVINGRPIYISLDKLLDAIEYNKEDTRNEDEIKDWEKKHWHLAKLYPDILNELRDRFNETLDSMKQAVAQYLLDSHSESLDFPDIQHELKNNPEFINLRIIPNKDAFVDMKNIGYKLVNRGIAIKGEVIALTQPEGKIMRKAYVCNNHVGTIFAPEGGESLKFCKECADNLGKKVKLEYWEQENIIRDFQHCIIKEIGTKTGEKPAEIRVWLFDKLCWNVKTGQHITVYGKLIYKSKGKDNDDLRRYIVANNVYENSERQTNFELTDADIRRFEKDVQQPYHYERLVKSFAPHTYGMRGPKELCILVLASVKSPFPVNGMLFGDSSIAKSKLIRYTVFISEKGGYINFSGVENWANLSAYAKMDTESQQHIVTEGTILRSDLIGGDEFHNINPEIAKKLNEWLSDKTITYSKGGETHTVKADTANIIGSNTAFGNYDPTKSLAEHFKFLAANRQALMSRFVMTMICRDIPDKELDRKIAKTIVKNHTTPEDELKPFMQDYIDKETGWLLYGVITQCKYFKWVQSLKIPIPSDELAEHACNDYVDARQEKNDEIRKLITSRYFNVTIENAQLYARLHNRTTATIADHTAGYSILAQCLKDTTLDPETNTRDTQMFDARNGKAENIKYQNKEDSLIFAIKEMLLEKLKLNNDTSGILVGYKVKHRAAAKSQNFQHRPHAFTNMLRKFEHDYGVLTYNELTDNITIHMNEWAKKYGELDADTK